jgi:hypothetical protein
MAQAFAVALDTAAVEGPLMATSREQKIAALFLFIGGVIGFGAGVLSVKSARELFANAFKSEERADTSSPSTFDRPKFKLQHPSNWKVDAKDKDYDPDHMFSIETPGQSFVMFVIADGELDPKETMDLHVNAQLSKVIKDASRTPFTKWGSYTGSGTLLRGKLLGLTPGSVRIFAWRSSTQTYAVIESTFDEDRAKVSPGFDLVERTFAVKD